jgi:hypothetical protein
MIGAAADVAAGLPAGPDDRNACPAPARRGRTLSARLHMAAAMSTGAPSAAAAARSASSSPTAPAVILWYAASPLAWNSGCSAPRTLLQ